MKKKKRKKKKISNDLPLAYLSLAIKSIMTYYLLFSVIFLHFLLSFPNFLKIPSTMVGTKMLLTLWCESVCVFCAGQQQDYINCRISV